jgi:hypothetical protein
MLASSTTTLMELMYLVQLKAGTSKPEDTSQRVSKEDKLPAMALRRVDQAGMLRLGLEKRTRPPSIRRLGSSAIPQARPC